MAMMKIKRGDTVKVIAGADNGKQGKILEIDHKAGRVKVEGVNIVKKHQKARTQTDPSGIIEREGSIDASNVKIVCPKCGKATRVSTVVNADGSKDRVCKKCGAVIDTVKKAK